MKRAPSPFPIEFATFRWRQEWALLFFERRRGEVNIGVEEVEGMIILFVILDGDLFACAFVALGRELDL